MRFGQYQFYAITDSTGQIAVDEKMFGIFSENTAFGLVGTIGEFCVYGTLNEDEDSWNCDKKGVGLITKHEAKI
ncbi:hypothetical protein HYV80_06105 [Candidatus Woesearchaeota archaeon]|nr:hypothetical protein [Candidatus Woesearchaeota archaeon]